MTPTTTPARPMGRSTTTRGSTARTRTGTADDELLQRRDGRRRRRARVGSRLHGVHLRLIYQWQPGALNESYSDIWGETIDLINDRMDGEEGTSRQASRRSLLEHTTRAPCSINWPAAIAKICQPATLRSALPSTRPASRRHGPVWTPPTRPGPADRRMPASPLTNATPYRQHRPARPRHRPLRRSR